MGRRTDYAYDHASRLIRIDRPVRVDGSPGDGNPATGVATRAYDLYGYDVAGQRITHTNALGDTEKTYYDSLGRITRTRSFNDFATSYTYSYSQSVTGLGGIVGGGWTKTTTQADGYTLIDQLDMFGRVMWHQDLGEHQFVYTYNHAGWLTSQSSLTGANAVNNSGQHIAYTHYGNGYVESIHDKALGMYTYYAYDANGNKTYEGYLRLKHPLDLSLGAMDYYQTSTIKYDSHNRMTDVLDPKVNLHYEYDAVDKIWGQTPKKFNNIRDKYRV